MAPCFTIDHFNLKSRFFSFNFQTCFESSGSFLYALSQKDFSWLLYLFLNSLDVIPMYCFFVRCSILGFVDNALGHAVSNDGAFVLSVTAVSGVFFLVFYCFVEYFFSILPVFFLFLNKTSCRKKDECPINGNCMAKSTDYLQSCGYYNGRPDNKTVHRNDIQRI